MLITNTKGPLLLGELEIPFGVSDVDADRLREAAKTPAYERTLRAWSECGYLVHGEATMPEPEPFRAFNPRARQEQEARAALSRTAVRDLDAKFLTAPDPEVAIKLAEQLSGVIDRTREELRALPEVDSPAAAPQVTVELPGAA